MEPFIVMRLEERQPLLASHVKKVHDVLFLEEFGVPEALWCIEVEKFSSNCHDGMLMEKVYIKEIKQSLNKKCEQIMKGL